MGSTSTVEMYASGSAKRYAGSDNKFSGQRLEIEYAYSIGGDCKRRHQDCPQLNLFKTGLEVIRELNDQYI